MLSNVHPIGRGGRPVAGHGERPGPVGAEDGKSWLDLPAGYDYAVDADAVKRVSAVARRKYAPSHIAIVAVPGGSYVTISLDPDPPDAADWQDVGSPAWKERLLGRARASLERPRADGKVGMKVLGWYAEPAYHAGPPRRMAMPTLIQGDDGRPFVKTLGAVSTAERQLFVHADVTPEQQAATANQVDAILSAVHFGPLPDDTLPSDLHWQRGPARLTLPATGGDVSVNVPADVVYLSETADLIAYAQWNGAASPAGLLSVLAPATLDWTAIVRDVPDGLGPDHGVDPLATRGRDGLLAAFRSMFEQTEGGPKLLGYQGEPAYTPGPRRSLFVPMLEQAGESPPFAELAEYIASGKTCVLLSASVRPAAAKDVTASFRTLAKTIDLPLPAVIKSQVPRPPQASPPSAPDWVKTAEPLARGLVHSRVGQAIAAFVVLVVVICLTTLRKTLRLFWRAAFFIWRSARAKTTPTDTPVYDGPEPPPLPDRLVESSQSSNDRGELMSKSKRFVTAAVLCVGALAIIGYATIAGNWLGDSWMKRHPESDTDQAFNAQDRLRQMQVKYQQRPRGAATPDHN